MQTMNSAEAVNLLDNKLSIHGMNDGLFIFVDQAQIALDVCMYYGVRVNENNVSVDYEIFVLDIYERKENVDSICNIRELTTFNESFFDTFTLIKTHYFDDRLKTHLALAELIAAHNHF